MITLAALLSLLFVGCSAEVEHEKFPGGAGRTTESRQAEVTQAVLGGIDPLNNPLAENNESKGPKISGVVTLAEGLSYKPGMSFFISARPAAGGPPLAVKRLGRVQFPYSFELSAADRMMEGTQFEGEVLLSIRLDQDGNPLSRQPGDMAVQQKTKVGTTNLKLVLEEISQ